MKLNTFVWYIYTEWIKWTYLIFAAVRRKGPPFIGWVCSVERERERERENEREIDATNYIIQHLATIRRQVFQFTDLSFQGYAAALSLSIYIYLSIYLSAYS